MKTELLISGVKGVFEPVVCSDIRLSTKRWGAGSMEFSVLKEGSIDFKEGNCVSFKANGKNMFYGYVFSKSRTKNGIIKVLCYDQMRYLKNKDTYTFTGQTASQIFNMITRDYNIKVGDVEPSYYVIPPRVEDNTTLMDILYKSVALTNDNGGGQYIIYDDYGRLCFKNTKYMVSNLLCDKESVLDFDYKTTIDKNVYNSIKLIYKRDTKYTHKLNVFTARDEENIKNWGVLQYYDHIDINKQDGNGTAQALLKKYNVKNRKLKILTFGNVNIRAGWSVNIDLDIGDFVVKDSMLVRECCHIFDGNSYTMELTLEGGVLIE